MSLENVIAPLLEFEQSGFIERSFWELEIGELRRLVRAGLVRERIILKRPPEIQRAQEAVELSHKRKHRVWVLQAAEAHSLFDPRGFLTFPLPVGHSSR